jgi:hypothetical protein
MTKSTAPRWPSLSPKLDLLAFVSSPEFIELVKGLAASGALGADAPSAADLDQALGMLGMMGPMIFQGLTSESSTAVSIDEPNYVILGESTLFSWDLTSLLADGGDERRGAGRSTAVGPIAD